MQESIDSRQPNRTSPEINPFNFPLGYFDAQVRFAQKWSDISGDDFVEVLFKKTALYRRITEGQAQAGTMPEGWDALSTDITHTTDPAIITRLLYDAYTESTNSKYVAPTHAGALGYDYQPDTRTVKIHFSNPNRGESPLSDANMPQRQQEFHRMLEDIRVAHPEAALLMSATWLRSTAHYRSLSPPDIAEQRNLMSANMKLTGNSVWGQFIDSSGNTNERVYDQFMKAVEKATSLDELLEAFPYKTLLSIDPIEKYYEYYGVIETATPAK